MSRIIRKDVHWIVATSPVGRPGPGADILCQRCGRRDPLPTPCPVDAIPYFTRAFQELHLHCKVPA